MAEIHGKYVYDDSLRPGQSEDGGWSQLLFDREGKLADHAFFIPDDAVEQDSGEHVADPDSHAHSADEIAQTIAVSLGVATALVVGAVQAAPHVRKWWSDACTPRRSKFGLRRRKRSVTAPPVLPAAPEDFTHAVDHALDQFGEHMSKIEAKQRLACGPR